MPEVGKILQNRYRIEKQIGQGGMGKVYVASDERFKSTVAIKETIFEDKNLRLAFEREARLLNSLKHQALPRVSDHFTEDAGQFLVMEYIAGEDLAEMMDRKGSAFALDEVLDWANQLCDALDYLHAQDIIHRDIKPQNLKLTPNGQIVLLDFGLAKGNPTDNQHQSAAKSIFGYSRSYASLEQIQGTGTEPRSDLYSLAATLYHLLTGIPPADALTRAMNVLNKQPDPLIAANLVNRNIPVGVADVLQQSMALNAGERPVSANALKQLLDESDRTVDPNAVDLESPTAFTADFLTQETKLKPLATNATANQSKVATKIISSSDSGADSYRTTVENKDSVVTNVRSSGSSVNNSAHPRKIAIAALAVLLLAGTAFSVLYFSASNNSQNFVNENTNTIPSGFVIQTKDANSLENANSATNTVAAVAENTNTKLSETNSAPKSVQPTKNQTRAAVRNQSETRTNSKSENDDSMIVDGDRVETKDYIIDENGVRAKNRSGRTQMTPQIPMPPNTDYQGMSPADIKKLEQLKNMRRIIVVRTPTPKPTP